MEVAQVVEHLLCKRESLSPNPKKEQIKRFSNPKSEFRGLMGTLRFYIKGREGRFEVCIG
jgi:hypothetical protein